MTSARFRLRPFLLRAAIDRAWSRPITRLWVHTRTFDHPKALGHYQRAGFVVYARQELRFAVTEGPELVRACDRLDYAEF